ncbi:SDR family oxidoreductase [Robbsia sp. KACC 23696]|uniref:SDR family oxidoreductase n=1 Tax=Robbsia sp. KACC 23696 TaxID=3149231 RepID=UPI00325AF436
MKIKDSVVFISGANRGLGLQFATEAWARGAKKVYAGARDPSKVNLPGVIPIKLDITNPDDVLAVAKECSDITLLINNAGIVRIGGVTQEGAAATLREQLETNLFGTQAMGEAFAPALGRNGGGTILNILSLFSWTSTPMIAGYAVSKAAAWALTNAQRNELRAQSTQVTGFHAGFIDTDFTRGLDVPKSKPEDVVRMALDAIEAGDEEVLVDDTTRQVRGGLSHSVYLKDAMAQ